MADTSNVRCRKTESGANGFIPVPDSPGLLSFQCNSQFSTSCEDSMNSINPIGSYKTATEYGQAVHQWLVQYHLWNQMNWFYMTFPMQLVNFRHQTQYNYYGYPTDQNIPGFGTTPQPNGSANTRLSFDVNSQQNRTQPGNERGRV